MKDLKGGLRWDANELVALAISAAFVVSQATGTAKAASIADRRVMTSKGKSPARCQKPRFDAISSDGMTVPAVRAGTNLKTVMLQIHNAERAAVGSTPLVWDDKLASSAQAWGNTLLVSSVFTLRHDNSTLQKRDQGENIAGGPEANSFSAEDLVGDWLAEKIVFNAGGRVGANDIHDVSLTCQSSDVWHYAQMVWASTTKIGCAITEKAATRILICRYMPSGNTFGATPLGSRP